MRTVEREGTSHSSFQQSIVRLETIMTVSTDVATIADNSAPVAGIEGAIAAFNNGSLAVYSSIKGTDFAAKLKVAAAVTSSEPVAEHLGKTINMVNVVIHPVELVNEETGELQTNARTVIIDDKGKAYHAISGVIFTRLRDLLAMLGEPATWPEGGVKVQVSRVKGEGARFFYDLRLV